MTVRHWWFGHRPGGFGFDGASLTSRCIECGAPILQDSQGNWFAIRNPEPHDTEEER